MKNKTKSIWKGQNVCLSECLARDEREFKEETMMMVQHFLFFLFLYNFALIDLMIATIKTNAMFQLRKNGVQKTVENREKKKNMWGKEYIKNKMREERLRLQLNGFKTGLADCPSLVVTYILTHRD